MMVNTAHTSQGTGSTDSHSCRKVGCKCRGQGGMLGHGPSDSATVKSANLKTGLPHFRGGPGVGVLGHGGIGSQV